MAWQSITMEEFIEIRAEEAAEIAAEKATAETTERVTREVTEEVTLEVTRKAIQILIADNLEEGKTEAQIIEKLKRHYDLSKDEAAIYIEEMCGKK